MSCFPLLHDSRCCVRVPWPLSHMCTDTMGLGSLSPPLCARGEWSRAMAQSGERAPPQRSETVDAVAAEKKNLINLQLFSAVFSGHLVLSFPIYLSLSPCLSPSLCAYFFSSSSVISLHLSISIALPSLILSRIVLSPLFLPSFLLPVLVTLSRSSPLALN